MDPRYFLALDSLEEVGDFLEGARLRSRDAWETARMIAFIVAKVGGSESEDLEEFLPLEWDKEKSEDDGKEEEDRRRKEVLSLQELAKKLTKKE